MDNMLYEHFISFLSYCFVYIVLGSFLSSLNTFIEEEHALEYNTSQYHVYDFMKVYILLPISIVCHESVWILKPI